MSHISTVIQCVIVKGSDNRREEGSPNDKLRTCTKSIPEAVHLCHVLCLTNAGHGPEQVQQAPGLKASDKG